MGLARYTRPYNLRPASPQLLGLGLALIAGTAMAILFWTLAVAASLEESLETRGALADARIGELSNRLEFDARRNQLLADISDEIQRVNPRLDEGDALSYAGYLVRGSEKYPTVDPLLFLAVGIVESGYNPRATSHANAKGLYQIWPRTGKHLARLLGWEYSDELLYEPEKNTELAALYLDILFTTYHDERMVLAEYNGGPINAGYLRARSSRTAAETRDYVVKVGSAYERLRAKLGSADHVEAREFHRDENRAGKRLID